MDLIKQLLEPGSRGTIVKYQELYTTRYSIINPHLILEIEGRRVGIRPGGTTEEDYHCNFNIDIDREEDYYPVYQGYTESKYKEFIRTLLMKGNSVVILLYEPFPAKYPLLLLEIEGYELCIQPSTNADFHITVGELGAYPYPINASE